MDIRDLQLTSFAENGSGRMITSGGKANSYGVELSLRSRITDGLTADLNYGFTRATPAITSSRTRTRTARS